MENGYFFKKKEPNNEKILNFAEKAHFLKSRIVKRSVEKYVKNEIKIKKWKQNKKSRTQTHYQGATLPNRSATPTYVLCRQPTVLLCNTKSARHGLNQEKEKTPDCWIEYVPFEISYHGE